MNLCCCRPTVSAQATYEKSVFAKTNRTLARGEGASSSASNDSFCCVTSWCLVATILIEADLHHLMDLQRRSQCSTMSSWFTNSLGI